MLQIDRREYASPQQAQIKSKQPLQQTNAGGVSISRLALFWAMGQSAVAKTPVPFWEVGMEALALSLRYWRHLASTPDFRLKDGVAGYYKDADRTYLASRLGEAVGYYFASQILGYPRILHFEAAKGVFGASETGESGRSRPDYVLVKRDEVALAEFKGRICPKGPPGPKSDLSKALAQCVNMEMHMGTPVRRKYGIATYFVESSSPTPSVLCHIDPEGDEGREDILRSVTERVATWSFAGALALAGFEGAARASRDISSESPRPEATVLRRQIGGKAYAFALPLGYSQTVGPDFPRFGVLESILRHIESGSERGDWMHLIEPVSVETSEEASPDAQAFRDGTAIITTRKLLEGAEDLDDLGWAL